MKRMIGDIAYESPTGEGLYIQNGVKYMTVGMTSSIRVGDDGRTIGCAFSHEPTDMVEQVQPADNIVREIFLTKIKDFIDTPNHSKDGGWSEVSEGELNQFFELVQALIVRKWGQDCDGDSPVSAVVWDNSKCQLPWRWPLPRHDHKTAAKMALSAGQSYLESMRIHMELDR